MSAIETTHANRKAFLVNAKRDLLCAAALRAIAAMRDNALTANDRTEAVSDLLAAAKEYDAVVSR